MHQSIRNPGKYLIVFMLTAGICGTERGFAYQAAEHTDIGECSRTNYVAYVQANPDTAVGTNALTIHWVNVAGTIVSEDTDGFMPYRRHFYDPVTGNGLTYLGITHQDAVTRSIDFWNNTVLPEYRDGNYANAYQALGRVAHLTMDMGVPAHVNLDPHPASEFYESTYITVPANRIGIGSTGLSSAGTVRDLMHTLATASRNFDSNDRNGLVDLGTRRAGGFTATEGAGIAIVCYPGAIEAVGGLFKLFYDTVKPIVQLDRPVQEEIHSGLIGIPFEAKANSYNKAVSDADYIQKVLFDYAEEDAPAAIDWVNAGLATVFDAAYKYTYTWNNSIDDDKVWVRAIAIDDGECESLPDKTWIKIDSTRPTVSNTSP